MQIQEIVKLAHRDQQKTLCVYKDASEPYWSAVLTQCEASELDKPTMEQKDEPFDS